MKKLVILSAFLGLMVSTSFAQTSGTDTKTTASSKKVKYVCPKCHAGSDRAGNCMKCNVAMVKVGDYYCTGCGATNAKPGKCAKCNMQMVKMTASK